MDEIELEASNYLAAMDERSEKIRRAIEDENFPPKVKQENGNVIRTDEEVRWLDELDSIVVYFVLASQIIDKLEKSIFQQVFVKKEHQDGDLTIKMGKSRRDLLNQYDIWDDELAKNAKKVGCFRDEMAHLSIDAFVDLHVSELEDKVDLAKETVEQLMELHRSVSN